MPPPVSGLSEAEVQERRREGRINFSRSSHAKSTREIFLENTLTVFNLINFAIIAFLFSVFIWSKDTRLLLDSIGIITVVVSNTAIAIVQEFRTRTILENTRLLLSRQVTAVRDGKEIVIDPSDIVEGDVLKIHRGEYAVVDGRVLFSSGLEMDESLLTGESLTIEKPAGTQLFSGSYCVAGMGYYVAERVGSSSYASRITALAREYKFVSTPLQKKIDKIFVWSFVIALGLAFVEILMRARSGSLSDLEFIRRIATVVITLLPEGLVFFTTVVFAAGVYRVMKLGAVVQKLNAIESFSTIDVVCLDKTGTLTESHLSLHAFYAFENGISESDIQQLLGTFVHACSDSNATILALRHLPRFQASVVAELPFNSSRKFSALQLKTDLGEFSLLLGAYELLLPFLDEPNQRVLNHILEEKNLRGYRNLLFARLSDATPLSELAQLNRLRDSQLKLKPLALISLSGAVRPDAPDALKLFADHNIEVKILSGDSADSVQATLNDIGWKITKADVITGAEIDTLDAATFAQCVQDKRVFARLSPEHKQRIIRELNRHRRTAMIGDGVNDVPAVKESTLGIAMEEGSSITKEIADIVLLKNKFSLLPKIFEQGRLILNTVLSIAQLYLTKNLIVLLLEILTMLCGALFPLTPRRSGLLSLLGVAMPVYFITAFNTRTAPPRAFFIELFSFIAVSLVAFATASYLSQYLTQLLLAPTLYEEQMAMTSALVIMCLGNFIYLSMRANAQKLALFVWSSVITLLLYAFLTHTSWSFFPINAIKIFYEIENFRFEIWGTILLGSSVGLALLFALHHLCECWLNRLPFHSRRT
ncbi:MAG: HAD family hydrolase [Candidatus Thermochlorobacter aerophilum]|jgi:cation-transporting ATPase E|uniref:HAD family hydrolase n=1 Tax=Candidatus Thermochlorobacter aerophilus TaxID=1868324 RepID=A0A395M0W0_9BACT|nr:MAG: HAD family hydrolase [Candidatus Thermochlorobacter aerophilum]